VGSHFFSIEEYEKRLKDLGVAISREMGAPEKMAIESQAGIGLSHLKTALLELKSYPFEEKLGTAHVFREPIGVTAGTTF
jgi:aldehyde dehydrogenase (NAD+)